MINNNEVEKIDKENDRAIERHMREIFQRKRKAEAKEKEKGCTCEGMKMANVELLHSPIEQRRSYPRPRVTSCLSD